MLLREILTVFKTFNFDWSTGNPRVTPEVTRDVCLLARMMAANLYYSQIEDLMFEVFHLQQYANFGEPFSFDY